MSDQLRAKIELLREQFDTDAAMAKDLGVPEHSLRRYLKGGNIRGAAWSALVKAARQFHPDTRTPALVQEATPAYALGVLEGQAKAVRQFLVAALHEQDNLIQGIRRMADPPTPLPEPTDGERGITAGAHPRLGSGRTGADE